MPNFISVMNELQQLREEISDLRDMISEIKEELK